MTKLKRLFERLPHPIRAGVTTAFWTFVTLFTTSATGWARDFLRAITEHQPVPKVSVLVAAAVSAAGSALAGLGNTIYRYVQSKGWLGLNPQAGPKYNVQPFNYATVTVSGTSTASTGTLLTNSNMTSNPTPPVKFGDPQPPATSGGMSSPDAPNDPEG